MRKSEIAEIIDQNVEKIRLFVGGGFFAQGTYGSSGSAFIEVSVPDIISMDEYRIRFKSGEQTFIVSLDAIHSVSYSTPKKK